MVASRFYHGSEISGAAKLRGKQTIRVKFRSSISLVLEIVLNAEKNTVKMFSPMVPCRRALSPNTVFIVTPSTPFIEEFEFGLIYQSEEIEIAEFPLNCPWYRIYEIVIEGPPDSISTLSFILANPYSRSSPPPPYYERAPNPKPNSIQAPGGVQPWSPGNASGTSNYPMGGGAVYPGGTPSNYPSGGKLPYPEGPIPNHPFSGQPSYPARGPQINQSPSPLYPVSGGPNIGLGSMNSSPSLYPVSGGPNIGSGSTNSSPNLYPKYPTKPGSPGKLDGSIGLSTVSMGSGSLTRTPEVGEYGKNPVISGGPGRSPGSMAYPTGSMGSGVPGRSPGSMGYPTGPMGSGVPGRSPGSTGYPMNPMPSGAPGSMSYGTNYPNPSSQHLPGSTVGFNNVSIGEQGTRQYPHPQFGGIGSTTSYNSSYGGNYISAGSGYGAQYPHAGYGSSGAYVTHGKPHLLTVTVIIITVNN
ncbi:hypothetical protein FO519_001752 [Halicephalobus sp. NKZ332]|nr:hypothetical protein FO519_001752 [Halicephalobus sp. NKZ332]